MKAVIFNKNTVEPMLVQDWAKPVVEEGEVLVRLKAAALNHRDLHLTNPNNPSSFIYGSDGAGIVEEIGDGINHINIGDEVILNSMVTCMECPACLSGDHSNCENHRVVGGVRWGGTFAEFIKIPARNVVKKPVKLSMVQAAALPMAMGTAWRALMSRGQLKEGETVLIQGIGGGVALACLQIALKKGAKVIVTSGSNDKLDQAVQLGAAAGINYKEEDVIEKINEVTNGNGVDLAVASTGEVISTSVKAVRPGGRVIQFAYIGKCLESFDIDLLMSKQIALLGSAMHSYTEFNEVVNFINENKLEPIISEVYPLEEYQSAFQSMQNSTQFGKIVLTL